MDEVWHAHILDTRRYAADCDCVFGEFIHHYPYFGLGDKHGDRRQLVAKYQRTKVRYIALFQEAPPKSVWGESPE